LPPDARLRVEGEVRLVERHVVAPVDRLRVERELLVHQPQQRTERRDARRDDVALDPRDRGLRRARTSCELPLSEPMAASRIAQKFPWVIGEYDIK